MPSPPHPVETARDEAPVGGRTYVASAVVGLVAVFLPVLAAGFPVSTDLPQHLGQVRLLHEALSDPASPYVVQWLTPYSLVYALLAAAWAVAPGVAAGKLGLFAIAALYSASLHALAWRRRRPVEAAFLCTALFLGTSLHWGFLSFIIGLPVFLFFWERVEALGSGPPDARIMPQVVLALAGLYAAHALWLGAGLVWLCLSSLGHRVGWKRLLGRLCWVVPIAALAAVSARRIQGGFDSGTRWATLPTGRLSPTYWAEAAMGGTRDLAGLCFLLALAGWVALALAQRRRELGSLLDGPLAWAGGVFALGVLVLPTKFMNTIQFEGRWAAPALCCLLLAMPTPAVGRWLRAAFCLLTVFAVSANTAVCWHEVNTFELTGLRPALAALPPRPRVLGLSFFKESAFVAGRPFIQTFAWAQVVAGGELNFSFADFEPMPVVYRERRPPRLPWTNGLEWYPERVLPRDVAWFDFVLVGADDALHQRLTTLLPMVPVTVEGRWRLYRVTHRT